MTRRWDAVVVLGAAVDRDGTLSRALAERVRIGAWVYRLGVAPRVVVTGHGEAAAMAREARLLGVPDAALVLEDRARTTRENALEVARLLGRGARVVVVTQPWHQRRAVGAFRRAGLVAAPWLYRSQVWPTLRGHARELGAFVIYRLRRWS